MSGLEIVGVVLGALPILLEGSKLFRSHLKQCSVWWKFRDTFEGMVGSIEDQMIAHRQNVKFLLRPLELNSETETSLLNDYPPSKDWHDPAIQASLRLRIGHDEFVWLMSKFGRLDGIVQEVTAVLPISNGKACLPAPGTIDQATLRLAVSFSSKRKLLNEVGVINASISRFLESDLRIAQATIFGPAIMAKGRKEASVKSAAPFLALQAQATRLRGLFQPSNWRCVCGSTHRCGIATSWCYDKSRQKRGSLKLLLGPLDSTKLVKVKFPNDDCDGVAASEKNQNRVNVEQVSQLKNQLWLLDSNEHVKARKHVTSMLALSATQATLLPSEQDPPWEPRKREKLVKQPRTQHVGTAFDTAASTPSRQSAPKSTEVVGLGRHVRFAPTPSHTIHAPSTCKLRSTSVNIACDFLNNPLPSEDTSCLKDGENIISLSLDSPSLPCDHQQDVQDFENFYKSIPYLDQRIRLGVKLAYTILGLGTSVWFPQGWNGDDIKVSSAHPAVPYFTHECIRSGLCRDSPDPRLHAEMAIFTLGIVLLQLIFQETVEEQQFYESCCFNGQVTESTLEQAALEWQQTVEARYGRDLADVILRCVSIRFSVIPDLGKVDFIYEVLAAIVNPLEDYIKQF